MARTFWRSWRLVFIIVLIFFLLRRWLNSSSIYGKTDSIIGPHGLTIEVIGADIAGRGEQQKRTGKRDPAALSEMQCNIPVLEINGSEVIEFFKPPEPLKCSNNEVNWAFIDERRNFALIPERKGASCEGTGLLRQSDTKINRTGPFRLAVGRPLPTDFVSVSCSHQDSHWSGLLMSIVPETRRVDTLKKLKQPADWSGLNVFYLGFDSLSQMSFRRNLPKTVQFLEKELGAVVLNGYNIVGDGTPQAYIPILTGATEVELPLTRRRFRKAHYVDEVYPFAWKNFSDAGYVTVYGEDVAEIDTFAYRLKGFLNKPTDHYTRPFFIEAEKVYKKDFICHGSDPVYKPWLRYSREFMSAYPSIPKFLMLHHNLLTHNDINQVAVMDDDLAQHLRSLLQEGAFDNTLVIVMSDHGNRFAKLRETHQGQLEERLPFFSLALPKKFRDSSKGKQAWANLKANAARLTSPFDMHSTLIEILHWPTDFTTVQDARKSRSLSLWRPIPETRNCDQAGIEPHWCTCLDWQDAMKTDEDREISNRIAHAIVDTINEQTKEERKICALLSLKKLHYAKKLVPNAGVLAYKNVRDKDGFVPDLRGTTKVAFAHYQLKLATTPGRAIYEVTVEYHHKEKRMRVDLSSISHVNAYGDDPHCISHKNFFLATYCVCYDRI